MVPRSLGKGTAGTRPSTVTDSSTNGNRRRGAYVLFVGPGASGSLAGRVVPRWADALGRAVDLRPLDVGPDTDSTAFSDAYDRLVGDPAAAGVVITGHKVAMYSATADRCSRLSDDARRLREVNVLAVGPDGVEGHATDVTSMGMEADRIWPRAGGVAVCLGGGGAAAALCLHLTRRHARPERVIVCEDDEARAHDFRALFAARGSERPAVDVLTGDGPWDDVVAGLPDEALVVNATGMGKADDRSPLSSATVIPPGSTVWDLNYRGPLPFVREARSRPAGQGLAVEDGAHLFALGWLAALGTLFGLSDTTRYLDEFVRIAEEARR